MKLKFTQTLKENEKADRKTTDSLKNMHTCMILLFYVHD